MTAIAAGLGAAVLWAISTLSTSRSTRLVTPTSVLATVMVIGAATMAPFALAGGVPEDLGRREVLWLTVSGLANVAGLLLAYTSLRVGKVGISAPITSAQGAAAALIAVLAGETLAPGTGLMLAVIVVGVVLASMSRSDEEAERGRDRRGAILAGCAALLFGLGLYASGRMADDVPLAWVVFVPRVVGVLAFSLPMVALGRVRMTRAALPFVLLSGLCEISGLLLFNVGARDSIAVTAIVSSQFAALAAAGAYVLFGERLHRIQVAGVTAIVVGVAVLTGLQA
jgi:drug/metabolite transporter (DMT)-like permease